MATNNVGNQSTSGIQSLTSSGNFNGRTITGTSNQIIVSNGDGTAGNPTLSLTSTIYVSGISFDSGTDTLANYATGTFTPTVTASSTNPTVGYTTQVGRYTRIGNHVFINMIIKLSSLSGGSGSVRLSGLPFSANASAINIVNLLSCENVTITSLNWICGTIVASNNFMVLNASKSAGAITTLAIGTLASNSNFYVTTVYEV